MLIYQSLRGKWNKAESRYEFSTENPKLLYKGRVALAFGGGGSSSEVVATGPWQGQVPYVNMLMDQALQLYQGGPPQYMRGDLTADPNANMTGSWNAIAQGANNNANVNQGIQQGLLQSANNAGNNPINQVAGQVAPNIAGGVNSLIQGGNTALTTGQGQAPALGDALGQTLQGQNTTQQIGQQVAPQIGQAINQAVGGQTPQTQFGQVDATGALNTALNSNGLNPYTDQIVNAALRTSNEQFAENVLPQIGSQAGQANQFGGTRHGIAEGIAAKGLINQQGDIMSRLYGQAFDAGSADRNAALGLVAQGQQANQSAGLQQTALGLQGAQIGSNLVTQGNAQQLQAGQQTGQLLTQGQDLSQQAQSTGTAQASNLLQAGNSAAMSQYYQSLGMIPQLQANQMAQYGLQNQVGMQQYGLDQANIDAELDRYFYNMLAPYNALTQFQGYISGPHGSSLPTQTPQNYLPPGYTYGQPAPGTPGAPPGGSPNPPPPGGIPPAPTIPPPGGGMNYPGNTGYPGTGGLPQYPGYTRIPSGNPRYPQGDQYVPNYNGWNMIPPGQPPTNYQPPQQQQPSVLGPRTPRTPGRVMTY